MHLIRPGSGQDLEHECPPKGKGCIVGSNVSFGTPKTQITKDGNEYSNIRIFVFLTNNRMRFRIQIFVFFHVHIFHASFSRVFCLKFAFILAAPFSLNAVSLKVGMYHPCKLRCQFDTLLF